MFSKLHLEDNPGHYSLSVICGYWPCLRPHTINVHCSATDKSIHRTPSYSFVFREIIVINKFSIPSPHLDRYQLNFNSSTILTHFIWLVTVIKILAACASPSPPPCLHVCSARAKCSCIHCKWYKLIIVISFGDLSTFYLICELKKNVYLK